MAVLDNELWADAEHDAAVVAHTQSLLSRCIRRLSGRKRRIRVRAR